jgi:hypothetical protein
MSQAATPAATFAVDIPVTLTAIIHQEPEAVGLGVDSGITRLFHTRRNA